MAGVPPTNLIEECNIKNEISTNEYEHIYADKSHLLFDYEISPTYGYVTSFEKLMDSLNKFQLVTNSKFTCYKSQSTFGKEGNEGTYNSIW